MKVTLHNAQQAPICLQQTYRDHLKPILMAGYSVEVSFEHDLRTLEQNKQQWPYLQAFADQIPWDVNGRMVIVSEEDWKDILTSAYRNEVPRVAAGFNGSPPVMLGQRTSKFTRRQWPEWMEFLRFAAAERGVKVPLPKSMEGAYA